MEKMEANVPAHFRFAASDLVLQLVIKLRRPHQGLRGLRTTNIEVVESGIISTPMQILRFQYHTITIKHQRFQRISTLDN
jgi:hypothetical protein